MSVFNLVSHVLDRTLVFNLIMSKSKERVFYAVGIGHKAGVYNTWRECKEQVEGLPNPKYRKFSTLQEAEQFVDRWRNRNTPASPKKSSPSTTTSSFTNEKTSQEEYDRQRTKGELEDVIGFDIPNKNTVKMDTECGDSTNMLYLEKITNCEKMIDVGIGKVGEILSFLTDIKIELTNLKHLLPKSYMKLSKQTSDRNYYPKTSSSDFLKRCSTNYSSELNDGCSNSSELHSLRFQRMETNNDENMENHETPAKRKRLQGEFLSSDTQENEVIIKIKKEFNNLVPFTVDENEYVIVYTDGSCFNNGKINAKAGIGIWFGDNHPLNLSEPLKGVEPTNNNAEIQAARIACELAVSAGVTKLKICTDSEFLINCITKWINKWKSNGWMTEGNKPVKNRAELEKLLEVMSCLSVRWEKVAGHSQIKGNEMADRLANEGAENYVNDMN